MSKSHPIERHIPSSVVFGCKGTKNFAHMQMFLHFVKRFEEKQGRKDGKRLKKPHSMRWNRRKLAGVEARSGHAAIKLPRGRTVNEGVGR